MPADEPPSNQRPTRPSASPTSSSAHGKNRGRVEIRRQTAGRGGKTVTVVSASSIQVVLDTTQVLATSYQIWVENPNKPMSAMLPYRVSTTTCP